MTVSPCCVPSIIQAGSSGPWEVEGQFCSLVSGAEVSATLMSHPGKDDPTAGVLPGVRQRVTQCSNLTRVPTSLSSAFPSPCRDPPMPRLPGPPASFPLGSWTPEVPPRGGCFSSFFRLEVWPWVRLLRCQLSSRDQGHKAFTQTTEQGKTSPRKEPLSCEDFLGDSDVKESACSAGDPGSILGSGRSPGKGNGNPLQYSCLENSKDRGAWWAAVHEVAKTWA